MKFNWGTGIVIFFTLFAGSMIFAVVSTTKYPPQLVQKDYYALDLNYQDRLERKQNTAALANAPAAVVDPVSKSIKAQLPEGMVANTGSVKCYRSATSREDVTASLDNTASATFATGDMTPGRWHLEMEWETTDGKKYFWETALIVPGT
ncbi:MAG TPA: FixH family protein [Saprospiraceae bacterium]|nr:FixH family protein [Saprospiraceae bacterium]